MRNAIMLALLVIAGSTGLSLLNTPLQPRGVCRGALGPASRAAAVRCAYNPQPSKSRPKKVKSKTPKQKVKGPPAAASVVVPEQTFFEGAPSATEMIIPGVSVLTVVGVIPFAASVARQAWTRYKITNRRMEIASGFQGKDVVQIVWREIDDVKWLRRYGGSAGDMVFTLTDGAKVELRSMPDFDRNLAFIMDQLGDDVKKSCYYPDGPAKEYLTKVEAGELEKPVLPSTEAAAPDDAPAPVA